MFSRIESLKKWGKNYIDCGYMGSYGWFSFSFLVFIILLCFQFHCSYYTVPNPSKIKHRSLSIMMLATIVIISVS